MAIKINTTTVIDDSRQFIVGTATLTLPSGSAPVYMARAWVIFNGTGTVAIDDDQNVTSISDGGTGIYTINLTTAMPSATYAIPTSGHASTASSAAGRVTEPYSLTTSGVNIVTAASSSGTVADNAIVTAVFYDW